MQSMQKRITQKVGLAIILFYCLPAFVIRILPLFANLIIWIFCFLGVCRLVRMFRYREW